MNAAVLSVARLLFATLLLGGVTACTESEHQDLQAWMAENSQGLRGGLPKLPEILPYEAVPYEVTGQLDPFRVTKIEPEGKSKPSSSQGALAPDFDARELRNSILERYPLESLRMIGLLRINNRPMAVIQVEDKVRQVRVGDYMGQDFGMVVKISETDLKLRELIQDSAGDWVERESVLYLQSPDKGNK